MNGILKGLIRETDVNYYKGKFLKLIDLKAESKNPSKVNNSTEKLTNSPQKPEEPNNPSSPPINRPVNHNNSSSSTTLALNKVEQQLLTSKILKITSLNPHLWKGYASWKDKLKQLDSQEKIIAFQQKMEHKIAQKSKSQVVPKTKPEKFPLPAKIELGGAILVSLILFSWGITKRVKRRNLWKKKHRPQ